MFMAVFKVLLQHVAISTEENLKGLNQYRWHFGLDSNHVADKWEIVVRITALQLMTIKAQQSNTRHAFNCKNCHTVNNILKRGPQNSVCAF
jgi:hypothetical protein